jgi:hypothetical protein
VFSEQVVVFGGARHAKSIRNAFGTIPLLQNANLMELKHILARSAAPASLLCAAVNKISIDTWKLDGRGANAEQVFNGARPQTPEECIGSARKKVHTRLQPQNKPRGTETWIVSDTVFHSIGLVPKNLCPKSILEERELVIL